MSPIAVEPDFTRKYLESSNREMLVKKIEAAFDRVASNLLYLRLGVGLRDETLSEQAV